jgi:hypothetical protein
MYVLVKTFSNSIFHTEKREKAEGGEETGGGRQDLFPRPGTGEHPNGCRAAARPGPQTGLRPPPGAGR